MEKKKLFMAAPLMAVAIVAGLFAATSNALAQTENQQDGQDSGSNAAGEVDQQGQFDGQYGDQTTPDNATSTDNNNETSAEGESSSDNTADTDNVQQ